MPKIKVHEKALAHLSRGLYRSPASALRELVSNAWDANAKTVTINTNYPLFFQLSVQDNGDGFTKDDFMELMEGGVGNSDKRSDEEPLINDRPVIGRLGIGMLGIAQICGAFKVTSKPRKGEGFRAYVRLYDLLKERLDKDDETIVKELEVKEATETHSESVASEDEYTVQEIDIGEYEFDKEFDPDGVAFGTTIITSDVHPQFTQTFQESVDVKKFNKFKRPALDWSKNMKVLSNVRSLQELGDYWRLLWELSASCPIPYLNDKALPNKLVAEDQQRLESYNFKVIVDGIQLFKPVYLRGNPGGYTTKKIGTKRQKIYGKDLVFHGYLLVQEGKQIRPDELRGILVRINNVAIGYYDPSMLDYRFNEGPRSRWLTGEIYVDAGLEDALNIDRDSFNRFHPQFRAIQSYVHEELQKEIFPAVYKKIAERSTDRADELEKEHTEILKRVISEEIDKPVRVIQESKEPDGSPLQIAIVDKARSVDVLLPQPAALKTKKSNQSLAAAILAIYEVTQQQKDHDKRRKTFTDLLLKLLTGW